MSDHFEQAVETYGDMLFRISLTLLADTYDAEDAVQETFYRYVAKAHHFTGDEHRKAWLIRVCINICKDMLRFRKHADCLSIDEIRNLTSSEDNAQILGMLGLLEEKYRAVIHLHYVEGYGTNEISDMLGITSAAVKKRLQRGREKLREIYEKEAI